jgi:hypothetical protein
LEEENKNAKEDADKAKAEMEKQKEENAQLKGELQKAKGTKPPVLVPIPMGGSSSGTDGTPPPPSEPPPPAPEEPKEKHIVIEEKGVGGIWQFRIEFPNGKSEKTKGYSASFPGQNNFNDAVTETEGKLREFKEQNDGNVKYHVTVKKVLAPGNQDTLKQNIKSTLGNDTKVDFDNK